MKFWKAGILLFFLIGFITVTFAGTLSQTIYSPFNHTVEQESENYYSDISKKATTTLVDDRYKDFSEYYDDDISEPFCRIGGQYRINVFNDASPAPNTTSNVTYNLYYCKTTKDLLDKIEIPSSWKENDLVVYCNDGGDIVSQSTNFDYLTSQLNTYKACIVKNLDLDSQNVIIYGFEVGNRIVDNFPEYFYNFNTSTGPVLVDFSKKNETVNDWKLKEEFGGTVIVPYIKRTWNDCYIDSDTKQEVCEPKCKWEPRTIPEALNWTQETYPQAQVLVFKNNRVKTYTPPRDSEGNIEAGSCEAGPGPSSDTVYLFKLNVYYKNTNLIFTYKDGRDFYFDYDVGNHFYSLSNFYIDYGANVSLVPLLEVFPEGEKIDLSRVVLFRKQGDKMIYGYEKSINLLTEIFGDSVLPTYIVKLENFDGYGTSSCMNSLGSFDASNSDIDERSEVICDGSYIKIISNNINSNDKGYEAFHLFKNIVMGLK